MAVPTLDSGRLLLREYAPTDLDNFISILSNRHNLRFLPSTEPWPRANIEKWLESSTAHWRSEGFGWWILEHKDDKKAIGWCGLRSLEATNEVEVLYLLDESYWGKGLATEAAIVSVQYGLKSAGLVEIIGLVLEGNIGSIRVLEKCGFIFQETAQYFNIECLKYSINEKRFTEFF
jgi:RimJ/RimL family protein N-acetyltransferase